MECEKRGTEMAETPDDAPETDAGAAEHGDFDGDGYVSVAHRAKDIPVVSAGAPGSTVAPPSPPYAPDLDKRTIISLAAIAAAVAVILIVLVGWVVLPRLFATAIG